MTAYMDRVRRLTGDQPSLRVRPRSRFEPVPPSAEPHWPSAVPDATRTSLETAGPPPFDADGFVKPSRVEVTTERHPAAWAAADDPGAGSGLVREPPPGPPATTGITSAPGDVPSPGADSGAEFAPADVAAERSRDLSRSPTAPLRPEPPAPPSAERRSRRNVTEDPRTDSGQPVVDRSTVVPLSAAADHREAAPGRVGPARPATPGDLSHSDARRPAPPNRPLPTAGPLDQAPGSTGAAAGPDHPARPPGRTEAAPPIPLREPTETAGPYRGHLAAPVHGIRSAERADDNWAGEPNAAARPARPSASGPPAAAAQPDEVTVTIGRVEVRVGPPASAAAAPPEASGARPSRPQPSPLQDYLRARASGRVG